MHLRIILMADLQFLHSCIARNCDVYLDELQQNLLDTCGVNVSIASIWRALQHSGYTFKTVSEAIALVYYYLNDNR
jgi:hypothetical protein